jgi:hypothetical protein
MIQEKLHVPFLSKDGPVLCGANLHLSSGEQHAAVMYSYHNRIPLHIAEVNRIRKLMGTIDYDTFLLL